MGATQSEISSNMGLSLKSDLDLQWYWPHYQGAKGADAQQESRVLMLSDQARSDANPILLIDENDVTAGHAASIGQVDPEDMYYLMSRGLDKATAERLVVRGFLGSVIVEIPVKEVR